MKPSETPGADKRNGRGKVQPSGARKIGYIIVILIMVFFIYFLSDYRRWGLNFLTEDFDKCLIYIKVSIYMTIAANVLFIIYDNRWFKHIIQAVSSIAGALALIMIYVIFPFTFSDGAWTKWIRIGILALFIITVISIIVELIKGLRFLAKDPEAI
jgi:hypothetical protein